MTFHLPPIPQHHWLPAHRYRFGWRPLYGDFPYYQVSKDVYDALNAGAAPSLLNPFATIAYVQSKLEESRLKSAWGVVGGFAYGAGSRVVSFKNGVSSGGSYHGDTNFVVTPAVIVAVRGVDAQNTEHHGWSIGTSGVTNESMTILTTTWELSINGALWIACGR